MPSLRTDEERIEELLDAIRRVNQREKRLEAALEKIMVANCVADEDDAGHFSASISECAFNDDDELWERHKEETLNEIAGNVVDPNYQPDGVV